MLVGLGPSNTAKMRGTMSIRLFVSYQRSDSRHAAGRLRDRLSDTFGDDNVFFDVDSIEFGMDFRTVIRETLRTVDALVTVIGPHFDPSRLADQDDYVRQELEEALRQEKLVVPVLVDEAQMPRPSELPEQLRTLSYRNAAVVRPDPDFRRDVARLVESLKRAVAIVSSGGDQVAIPVAAEIGQLSTTAIEEEEQARREAEEQARREAEEQARREAEEQARREAEEQARREAEEQARRPLEPSGFARRRTKAEERAERRAKEQALREAKGQGHHGTAVPPSLHMATPMRQAGLTSRSGPGFGGQDTPTGVHDGGPREGIGPPGHHRKSLALTIGVLLGGALLIIGALALKGGNGDRSSGGQAQDRKPDGPPTQVYYPRDVAVAPDGSLFIASQGGHYVRRFSNGVVTGFAGNGTRGFKGDGGPAIDASLNEPPGVAVARDGSVYIADADNNRVRKVDANGIITTVAGNGNEGFSGDGGLATQASLSNPSRVVVSGDSTLYIADAHNNRVRKVDANGIITTVAGNGNKGFSGDGGLATQASLDYPSGLEVGADGTLYVADSNNYVVRAVDANGIITKLAAADFPTDIALASDGTMYIAEARNISRRATDGSLTKVMDTSEFSGVAVAADGSLYVADPGDNRIRRRDLDGTVHLVI